jgi:hypothetical protein
MMFKLLEEEYSSFWGDLKSYFTCYGGVKRVVSSPYTHLAILLTLACWRMWHSPSWYTTPLAVLPSLLGFTLAAYALLLAFGDEGFLGFLAAVRPSSAPPEDAAASVLTNVSAIFLHFVIVEIVALLMAVVGSSIWSSQIDMSGLPFWLCAFLERVRLGYAALATLAFNLAIVMALAAALDIYHATKWYVAYARTPKGSEPSPLPANSGEQSSAASSLPPPNAQ